MCTYTTEHAAIEGSGKGRDGWFTLRTATGGLVVGVGGQRFGADRVLVLQKGDGARHQSWTAVPG